MNSNSAGVSGAGPTVARLSLTDSMEVVNRILADSSLDRTERIERLESILTDMTEAITTSKGTHQLKYTHDSCAYSFRLIFWTFFGNENELHLAQS